MRQIQLEYENIGSLKRELQKISRWQKTSVSSAMIFDIYTQTLDIRQIGQICGTIREMLPEALYRGCSSNGNIFTGKCSDKDILIVCTLTEYPSTRMKILQYQLTDRTEQMVFEALKKELEENPWVKAVELLTTMRGMSMTNFCDDLSTIRNKVEIFGGGAFSPDINDTAAIVFSSEGGCSDNSVVFNLIGGDCFHVKTMHVTGWKPLGRELLVTASEGNRLIELDHRPAYETYYKYLKIANNEDFFSNTLEFPFFYNHKGHEILRAPVSANPDGSLEMTADMEKNVKARIAYGDPWTILDSVNSGAAKIGAFQPEVIHVYSCAARRTYWGDEASKETLPFQQLAPTSGFYTAGEFLRTGNVVDQHNVTLVVAAMREGDKVDELPIEIEEEERNYPGKVSMINRLATFIEAATEELEEANRQLENMAITDGLTQLYNRSEIQRRIKVSLEQYGKDVALVMIDIDNFKHINDTYGHAEGDNVLRALSQMLKDIIDQTGVDSRAGRWGGEEFMIYVRGGSAARAEELAERFRAGFEQLTFEEADRQTISVGVVYAQEGDETDKLCDLADNALYTAKRTGKNKVVLCER